MDPQGYELPGLRNLVCAKPKSCRTSNPNWWSSECYGPAGIWTPGFAEFGSAKPKSRRTSHPIWWGSECCGPAGIWTPGFAKLGSAKTEPCRTSSPSCWSSECCGPAGIWTPGFAKLSSAKPKSCRTLHHCESHYLCCRTIVVCGDTDLAFHTEHANNDVVMYWQPSTTMIQTMASLRCGQYWAWCWWLQPIQIKESCCGHAIQICPF